MNKQYEKLFQKFWNSKTQKEKEIIENNFFESLESNEKIINVNVSKLKSNLFTNEIMEILEKVSISNISIETMRDKCRSAEHAEEIKDNNTDKFRVHAQAFWWTYISGAWHLDFNHYASNLIWSGGENAESLAEILQDALADTPFAIALIPVCAFLLAESKIFEDNDKGNGVYIGFWFADPDVSGWGPCTYNWN